MNGEEWGTIIRVEVDTAWVRPENPTACRECNLCNGNGRNEIPMDNEMGGVCGDRVAFVIDIDELNRRFILFMVLLLMVLAGGVTLGFAAARLFSAPLGGTVPVTTTLGLSVVYVFLRRRRQSGRGIGRPRIVRIFMEGQ
jgi:hypothetical protein